MPAQMKPTTLALLPLLWAVLLLLVASPASMSPWSPLSVTAAPSIAGGATSLNSIYLELFRESLIAYQLQLNLPWITISTHNGRQSGVEAAQSGAYDWVVATGAVTDKMRASHPTLTAYPLATVAIAPAYNLPTSVGSATLSLTNVDMCRIWRGDITHWNDTAIQATNPLLRLPFERIIVPQLDYDNDATLSASRLCNKVDAGWAATIGASNNPSLPHVVGITQAQGSSGLAAFVLDTPYSIGFVSPVAVKTKMAELVNQAGISVAATPATVSQAFLELSSNPMLPDGDGYDLSNAQSAYAWPANMVSWLLIDTDTALSTCATKSSILKFLLWMYESPVVAGLADSFNMAMPPALYLKQSGLLDRMRSEIRCDGSSLLTADSTSASIRGNAMVTSSINLMTQLYGQFDATFSYSFKTMSDSLALDRIAVGEIDFAVVASENLSNEQLERFRAPTIDEETGAVTQGGMVLPFASAGVVPTFSLPTAITALYATRTPADDLGLPDLYPLVIDMETLAAAFTGNVSSWMDPRMQELNPRLKAWFDRTGAPTALRSVVCCTDASDPFVAGSIAIKHLLGTQTIQQTLSTATIAVARSNPRTLWNAVHAVHPSPSSMAFVDRETTVAAKLLLNPGSVSLRLINTAEKGDTTDFHLRVTDAQGAVETVAASPSSLMACVEPLVALPGFMDAFAEGTGRVASVKTVATATPGCWPLRAMASLAVARAFSSKNSVVSDVVVEQAEGEVAASHMSLCVRAQKNLELLRWMQISPLLLGALRNHGVIRLSDLPQVRSYLVDQRLNTATCDGKTILITLPIIWEVPGAATGFAIAMACLIILACAVTILGLYRYRHHPMIRSASPIFLAQVAAGLALLAGSLVAWASPVTDSSCLAFQWLVDLGFTLAFAPLFAKTWRIYQIFSAKKIKVVKISNGRLVWAVLAMLAFELVVLAAWTGVSPLQPVLYEQSTNQLDGAIRQLTHCAVEGAAGSAFLAIEAAFKGALLLFGCMMGFSTRKVSASFNESATIAWAIYNVVFTGLVVGAILLFLDTIGDTLIWLVLILFLWIAVGTWLLIFVPKATAVFGGDENAHLAANSISLGSLSKHDGSITFASITGMGRAQLQAYRTALEAQLEKIKKALGMANVQARNEGSLLDPRSNHSQPGDLSVISPRTPGNGGGSRLPPKSRTLDEVPEVSDRSPVDAAAAHVTSPTASAAPRRPQANSGLRTGLTIKTYRSNSSLQVGDPVSVSNRPAAPVAGAPQPGRPPIDPASTPTHEVLQFASPSASVAWSSNHEPLPAHLFGDEAHSAGVGMVAIGRIGGLVRSISDSTAPGLGASGPAGTPMSAPPLADAAALASATVASLLVVSDPPPTSPVRVAVSLAAKPSSRAQASPTRAHVRSSSASDGF